MKPIRLSVTLLIVAVITTQLSVGARALLSAAAGGHARADIWPFLHYPMYSDAKGPPVQTSSVQLTAELADGSTMDISMELMGLEHFAWRYHIVERLVADKIDPDREALQSALVERDRDTARMLVCEKVLRATGQQVRRLDVLRQVYRIDDGRLVHETWQQTIRAQSRFEDIQTSLLEVER